MKKTSLSCRFGLFFLFISVLNLCFSTDNIALSEPLTEEELLKLGPLASLVRSGDEIISITGTVHCAGPDDNLLSHYSPIIEVKRIEYPQLLDLSSPVIDDMEDIDLTEEEEEE